MNTQKDTSSDEIENLYLEFLEYLDTKPGNDIPGILIELEERIRAIVASDDEILKKYTNHRDTTEQDILENITGDRVNIGNLLETLAERVKNILKKSPEEIDREMGIFVKELEGIILPPGEGNIREGSGKSEVREEKELIESRYGKILELLRENEIYADDIIVYKGQLRTSQMRQVSYRVIQIPRLSKTIFVCDEYAEASFVVDSLVYPEVFLEHTKSDIREKLSATRIIHSLAWETRLSESLFGTLEEIKSRSTNEKTQTAKIDVRTMEEIREEILKLFPTPEDWMNLTSQQRGELKIHGKGLTLISRLFGLIGLIGRAKDNARYMALLGQKIYGEGYNIIDCEFWNSEEWKKEILKQFPTPENFMENFKNVKRGEFIGIGKGLTKILSIHGIDTGITISNFALLGQKVYGKGHQIIDTYLYSVNQWKEIIQQEYPFPLEIFSLHARVLQDFKIKGLGLVKIAGIFFPGKSLIPYGNKRDLALLLYTIYGKRCDIEIQRYVWSQKKWKRKIREEKLDPQYLLELTNNERGDFTILGWGLRKIAHIFFSDTKNASTGERIDPVIRKRDFALLLNEIYDDSPEIKIELWTSEKWKEEILTQFPNRSELEEKIRDCVSSRKTDYRTIKIHGKGLIYIANYFFNLGVKDPIAVVKDREKLLSFIYGENKE